VLGDGGQELVNIDRGREEYSRKEVPINPGEVIVAASVDINTYYNFPVNISFVVVNMEQFDAKVSLLVNSFFTTLS